MAKRKKVQKDKQRSTKHTYKTKDRVTRTSLKQGVNSGVPEGLAVPAPLVSETRRVNLATNLEISHERGKDRVVFTTSGTSKAGTNKLHMFRPCAYVVLTLYSAI